jgi:hypothetical protein
VKRTPTTPVELTGFRCATCGSTRLYVTTASAPEGPGVGCHKCSMWSQEPGAVYRAEAERVTITPHTDVPVAAVRLVEVLGHERACELADLLPKV